MYEEDLMASGPVQEDDDKNKWDPDHEEHRGAEEKVTQMGKQKERNARMEAFHEFKDGAMQGRYLLPCSMTECLWFNSCPRVRRRRSSQSGQGGCKGGSQITEECDCRRAATQGRTY